jgi:hypothetical protein
MSVTPCMLKHIVNSSLLSILLHSNCITIGNSTSMNESSKPANRDDPINLLISLPALSILVPPPIPGVSDTSNSKADPREATSPGTLMLINTYIAE